MRCVTPELKILLNRNTEGMSLTTVSPTTEREGKKDRGRRKRRKGI